MVDFYRNEPSSFELDYQPLFGKARPLSRRGTTPNPRDSSLKQLMPWYTRPLKNVLAWGAGKIGYFNTRLMFNSPLSPWVRGEREFQWTDA